MDADSPIDPAGRLVLKPAEAQRTRQQIEQESAARVKEQAEREAAELCERQRIHAEREAALMAERGRPTDEIQLPKYAWRALRSAWESGMPFAVVELAAHPIANDMVRAMFDSEDAINLEALRPIFDGGRLVVVDFDLLGDLKARKLSHRVVCAPTLQRRPNDDATPPSEES